MTHVNVWDFDFIKEYIRTNEDVKRDLGHAGLPVSKSTLLISFHVKPQLRQINRRT